MIPAEATMAFGLRPDRDVRKTDQVDVFLAEIASCGWTPGKDGIGLRRFSMSCAAIATNQRAPERQERLVNVGPLVISHP